MAWGRLFLQIQFETAGVVNGEATAEGFENLIELSDFDFGLKPKDNALNQHSSSSGGQGSKLQPKRLGVKLPDGITINKRFDASSTALMTAIKTRDNIKRGRIMVSQGFAKGTSGSAVRDAFYIEFTGGKIVDVKLSMSANGKTMELTEDLTLEVEQLRVFINPVKADGSYGPSAKPSNLMDVRDKTHQSSGGSKG
jgi:type VI protein secretion system component Hcp